jgi:NADH-quinone oxidoreductase subunit A
MLDYGLLLSPPVVFIILLATVLGVAHLLRRFSFVPANLAAGTMKPYACGEDLPDHLIQPDYSQFFPFAFYFTILHVAAMMAATVPSSTISAFAVAGIYLAGAGVGLLVLYRR